MFLGQMRQWWINRKRNIFIFHDGTRTRRMCPLAVGMKLEEVCPDYIDLLEIIYKDATAAPVGPVRDDLMRQKKEASLKLASVAQTVFGVKPLEELGTDGLTGPEAVAVLTRYFVFMQELAAAAELFPVSQAAG